MTLRRASTSTTKEVGSFFKTVIIFLAIAIFLRATVIEAFRIPSGSMIPTLHIGDHILVTKFNYSFRLPFIKKSIFEFKKPKRGEIVVFTREDEPDTKRINESNMNIIKRVIGIPGDIVEVRSGEVFINNELFEESYAIWLEGGIGSYGPYKIPEGKVLLLGDNRDQSKDSRFWADPYLDTKRIKGRALLIYFNLHELTRIGKLIR